MQRWFLIFPVVQFIFNRENIWRFTYNLSSDIQNSARHGLFRVTVRTRWVVFVVYSTRITDIDIIMYGRVFLYTVVVPDTYRLMQEYTVWPYDALNQGDGADKLLSIWSPNVPHDPLPLQQYLPGISCSRFGQGSCTASLLRSHLHRAHVTKINTEIKADVTLGRCQENGSGSVKV